MEQDSGCMVSTRGCIYLHSTKLFLTAQSFPYSTELFHLLVHYSTELFPTACRDVSFRKHMTLLLCVRVCVHVVLVSICALCSCACVQAKAILVPLVLDFFALQREKSAFNLPYLCLPLLSSISGRGQKVTRPTVQGTCVEFESSANWQVAHG